MHELSIAVGIVDLACDHVIRTGGGRIGTVHIRVGMLSGVVKEALLFSFDAAAAGTEAEGARLQIEDVPVTVWCPVCGAERQLVTVSRRRCPECDAVTPRVMRGQDLEVVALEILET